MAKVLITGASGFIGHHLAKQFGSRHEVQAPGRQTLDLLDTEGTRTYLEQNRFDLVVHSATERSNRGLPVHPELLSRNCRMFSNLARNRHAFGRMFFVSSGAIYDRAHWKPRMSESYFDAHVPPDDYGLSKYLCAKAIGGMQRIYELRLFGVFGPMEDWRVRFLSNACCRALWDLPVVIRQNVFFDFLDVEDLGWIVESLANRDLRYANYNICSGRALDLKTLAAMVVKASGKDLEIIVKREGWGVEYSGNNTRLLEEIPDFQFRDMSESIARLYQWYAERKETIDPKMLDFDDR